jgi:hypothetical protein
MRRDGEAFAPRAMQRRRNVCFKPTQEEAYGVSKIILGGNGSILSHEMVKAARAQLRRGCKAIYDVKRITQAFAFSCPKVEEKARVSLR